MPVVVPLFVYGSLMRSGKHHAELLGARFVGVARTGPCYGLREVDGYPALVPGTDEVPGELFEVDAALLPELDAFEGEAYRRDVIVLSDGARVQAYVLWQNDARPSRGSNARGAP
jgi:gamma-glutamylcyclotransferase (GGCT)/AIG2-like uncharacterized protein YtfP